eukprot:TRINITY_DN3969_c0_g1_i9.p1 TRINITY_DN3969_c0_g1~~TRINITY_DN3969_c0_g1_i9.p1  ORF type:complete len:458 (-),score=64.66 TRINITY_DN3969_c0_g1_i9:479-1852(-)
MYQPATVCWMGECNSSLDVTPSYHPFSLFLLCILLYLIVKLANHFRNNSTVDPNRSNTNAQNNTKNANNTGNTNNNTENANEKENTNNNTGNTTHCTNNNTENTNAENTTHSTNNHIPPNWFENQFPGDVLSVFLPSEITLKIFFLLDSPELCNLTLVSKKYLNLANNPDLWRILTENIGGFLPWRGHSPIWKVAYFEKKLSIHRLVQATDSSSLLFTGKVTSFGKLPISKQRQEAYPQCSLQRTDYYIIEIEDFIFGGSKPNLPKRFQTQRKNGSFVDWNASLSSHQHVVTNNQGTQTFFGSIGYAGIFDDEKVEREKLFPLDTSAHSHDESKCNLWTFVHGTYTKEQAPVCLAAMAYGVWIKNYLKSVEVTARLKDIFYLYAEKVQKGIPYQKRKCQECCDDISTCYYTFLDRIFCNFCIQSVSQTEKVSEENPGWWNKSNNRIIREYEVYLSRG